MRVPLRYVNGLVLVVRTNDTPLYKTRPLRVFKMIMKTKYQNIGDAIPPSTFKYF